MNVNMKSSLISIVDDDESVRESLSSLLRSAGFGTRVFASAEEFLNSAHRRDTACLILDLRMPGMSGLELQSRLSDADHKIPIIFITAHGEEGDRMQAFKAGAVDFLYKPFSEKALLKAVDTALKR
jgi:FixJ family two-component response regulator